MQEPYIKVRRFSTRQKTFTSANGKKVVPDSSRISYFKLPDGTYINGIELTESENLPSANSGTYEYVCDPEIFGWFVRKTFGSRKPGKEADRENYKNTVEAIASLGSDDYRDKDNLPVLARMLLRKDFLEFLSWSRKDFFALSVSQIEFEQIEERKEQTKSITLSTLQSEYYFSEKMIRELLPEPVLVKNPHFACAAPMKLYRLKDVEKAMETEAYKTAAAKKIARQEKLERAKQKRKEAARIEREICEKEWKEVIDQFDPVQYFTRARAMSRHFIIHAGPTNSGKTHEALQQLMKAENGIYCAPLRLLAHEVAGTINEQKIPCSMLTGEERRILPDAKILSCTIEMADLGKHYDIAVIDEAQMAGDSQRGGAWTSAIMGLLADQIHICAADYAVNNLTDLIEKCGDTWEVIHYERKTELRFEQLPKNFNEYRQGDAVIVFSRREVYRTARDLIRRGFKPGILYGAMPYSVKRNEARRFRDGRTDILVATDCIGMGLNLPIQRIVFKETEKFDGIDVRCLYSNEIQQIAGRAGRFGLYDVGTYASSESWVSRSFQFAVTCDPFVFSWPPELWKLRGPLSEILRYWDSLKTDYPKQDCDELIEKLAIVEKLCPKANKQDILHWASVPFKFRDDFLKDYWMYAVKTASRNEEVPPCEPKFLLDSIGYLEEYHDAADIYCHFATTENEIEYGMSLKRELSKEITKLVKKHYFDNE